MKELISKTFPCLTGTCLETVNHPIFWVDESQDNETIHLPKGKSFLRTTTNDDNLFTVYNESETQITFLAIDKGIFTDSSVFRFKRCDFALFDQRRFCFIECKDSVSKQRSKERNSAFEQLKETIQHFKQAINFDSYQLEAQVSLKAKKVFPRQQCTRTDKVKEFEDELNVALFENNEISF